MPKSQKQDLPSYSGRWVARLNGKVIANGSTREEALRAAKLSRPKEDPEIAFLMPGFAARQDALLNAILGAIPPGQTIYLVGGAIRDRLLGRPSADLDFAVPRDALLLARRVANQTRGAFFPLDPESDTARIVYVHTDGARSKVDFAAYRRPDLASDLSARDFTINAIALDPRAQELIDPLGGVSDLRERCIRACSEESFREDPVRILRAIRLAAGLRFQIHRATREQMKQAVPLLRQVSPERLRDELFKMLGGERTASCVRALDLLGALPFLLPELTALKGVTQPAPHVHDVWEHTLAVMGHLEGVLAALEPQDSAGPIGPVHRSPPTEPGESGDLFSGLFALRLGRYRQQLAAHLSADPANERTPRSILFFGALYHDIAKPQTRTLEEGRIRFLGHDEAGAMIASQRARDLRLSTEEAARIDTIVAEHMRIHFHTNRLAGQGRQPSRRAIYRFFRDAGETGIDLCLLALADLRATYEQTLPQETWTACLDVCRVMLENWWEKPRETVSPPSLVNGHDLMTSLGISPGPLVGKALEAVREAQATGKLGPQASRGDALTFARHWLEEESRR